MLIARPLHAFVRLRRLQKRGFDSRLFQRRETPSPLLRFSLPPQPKEDYQGDNRKREN
jgi:hypothetical protein